MNLNGAVADPSRLNLERAEAIRVEAPEFESLEELFAWMREEFRVGGRDRVVELRGKQLETVIYSLPPVQIVTPFGCLVLIQRPEAATNETAPPVQQVFLHDEKDGHHHGTVSIVRRDDNGALLLQLEHLNAAGEAVEGASLFLRPEEAERLRYELGKPPRGER